MTSKLNLLNEYFGQVYGLPCWDAGTELTCWLTLRFGQPTIVVREGNPESESERGRRRRVSVHGEFQLFFELGEWVYCENGQERFHAGLSREDFYRFAQRLQSQCLMRVRLGEQPAETAFEFDLGGRLLVRPTPEAEDDDLLWEFSVRNRHLRMHCNGVLDIRW